MQHTLVAVFDNRGDAQNALDDLLAAGFSHQEVRLSNADPTGQTDSLSGATTSVAETRDEGIGASIKHFFTDLFGSDNSEHALKYSTAVSRGHHVLTVNAADEPEVERAADIVERHGPTDIDEQAARWAGGAAVAHPESMRMSGSGGMQQSSSSSLQFGGDQHLFAQQSLDEERPMGQTYQEPSEPGRPLTAGAGSMQGSPDQGSQQRDTGTMGGTASGTASSSAIPVVREELKIGKREVQRGGGRVFSRVVETPVSESIGLREEHVKLERHQVDQPINPADATAFKEQSIEVRETAEEAVVEKSARVVEEVVVGKEVSEHQQQIRDTVRHTEVEVEQLGVNPTDDADYRSHWTITYGPAYGSYDEYAPAYSYGSTMARSEQYRGRAWNDVESDLRSGWEGRYGGEPSTWEKFKAAIRHGWDRITS